MTHDKYGFSNDFQDMLIACVVTHPLEFWTFNDIVKPDYFTGVDSFETVFALKTYIDKYGKYPNYSTLMNTMFARYGQSNPDKANQLADYVTKLTEIDTDDWEGVRDLVTAFAKERSLFGALKKVFTAQKDNKLHEINAVAEVEAALAVGEDNRKGGIELSRDYKEVIDETCKPTYGIRTGYPLLDDVWKTGWAPGWLVVPLAGPKGYKCLGKGTGILMFNGTVKPVEDIEVGDLVMGDDSTARTVTTCGKGHGPLYSVEQSSGKDFVCNDAHILCLKHLNGTIKEMPAEDYATKSKKFHRNWNGYKAPAQFPEQAVPLDAYLLGLWLGDGTESQPHVTVAKADPEIAGYLEKLAYTTDMCVTPGDLRPVVAALKALNVYENKHVPSVYKINSRSIRLQLLAGLMDSDGSYYPKKGTLVFVNVNSGLAEDVCWLARSLGLHARIAPYTSSIKSTGFVGNYWRVSVTGRLSEIPTRVLRKQCKDSVKRRGGRYSIEVKPIGDGDYYGFTVDGNQRYMLDDFTVTHNSTFVLNLALKMLGPGSTGDIIYYACEISDKLAMMRCLHNLTGLSPNDLFEGGSAKFKDAAEKGIKARIGNGKFFFKAFPSKTASIKDIEAHVKYLMQHESAKPKAILIDYAETVKPSTSVKGVSDWRQQAEIYIEAKAMGTKLNCCVIMPDRCNRETVGRAVPNVASFQGAMEKAGAVDIAIGICMSDAERLQNKVRYFVFLNRHGPQLLHFEGKVDPERMRMTIDKKIEYVADEDDEVEKHYNKGNGKGRGAANKGKQAQALREAIGEND